MKDRRVPDSRTVVQGCVTQQVDSKPADLRAAVSRTCFRAVRPLSIVSMIGKFTEAGAMELDCSVSMGHCGPVGFGLVQLTLATPDGFELAAFGRAVETTMGMKRRRGRNRCSHARCEGVYRLRVFGRWSRVSV